MGNETSEGVRRLAANAADRSRPVLYKNCTLTPVSPSVACRKADPKIAGEKMKRLPSS